MREELKKSFKNYLTDLAEDNYESDFLIACCARIILDETMMDSEFIDLYVAPAMLKRNINIDDPNLVINEDKLDEFWEASFFIPVINSWVRNPLKSIEVLLDSMNEDDVALSLLGL